MTSTRRIATFVALAAALPCLAVSSANAAGAAGRVDSRLNPVSELDSIAASGIPAKNAAQLPKVTNQLGGLNHLSDLNQLHQLTGQAAPVLGLLPAVE